MAKHLLPRRQRLAVAFSGSVGTAVLFGAAVSLGTVWLATGSALLLAFLVAMTARLMR